MNRHEEKSKVLNHFVVDKKNLKGLMTQLKMKDCPFKDGEGFKYASMITNSHIIITYYNPTHQIELNPNRQIVKGQLLPIHDVMDTDIRALFTGGFLDYCRVSTMIKLEAYKEDFDRGKDILFTYKEIVFKHFRSRRGLNG